MIGIVRMIAAGAVLVTLAAPAYAYQCPSLVAKIDKSLAAANLSAAQLEEVKQLRNDGEAKHKAGKHGDAIKTLNKALALLEGEEGDRKHVQSHDVRWPIEDESEFLAGLTNVMLLDVLTVSLTPETLPTQPEVWVMRYQ